ncbi:MAG: bifunctional acetate--CoA ligase family protein/GNAT family N-acetyltransferase [Halopseudomonas sp.]
MSTRYLKRFFKPQSIAVIGATEAPDNMGGVVLKNLVEGGFQRPIMSVGPGGSAVFGIANVATLEELGEMPELAIICAPADEIPGLISSLGESRVKAALVLGSDLSFSSFGDRHAFKRALKDAAQPYGIRILGPEGMGLLVPGEKMNASYSHQNIKKGSVAYVGQSGILGTAMIDWANGQGIGFSNFLTLGGSVDIDLASVVDYLAADPYTHSLLIQVDSVNNAQHFISAIRAAARNKLVLILKSNLSLLAYADRKKQLPPGVTTIDQVYDSVLTRCGAVRVNSSDELFDALETLTTMKPLRGARLALVSNGMAPNSMAVERLYAQGGKLARLTPETIEALGGLTQNERTAGNPTDLHADATPERYQQAVEILSKDANVDAVLALHAPTQMAPSAETAEAVIAASKKTRRNILTSWMGRDTAIAARNLFNASKVPTYITPEKAVDAFMHMVQHRQNQTMMKQTPTAVNLQEDSLTLQQARALVEQAMDNGRDYLRHEEVASLLRLYGIECPASYYADSIDGVVAVANKLDVAVAVKALHKDNRYPFSYVDRASQRWRDLALDLYSESEIRHYVEQLSQRVDERFGTNEQRGYCVQQMKRGFQSLQICTGVTRDPVFGPMIFFGVGGYDVDVQADRQLMLPPLNNSLAKTLIKRSRIYHILKQNSYRFEQDIDNLCRVLVQLSEMVIDLPELRTLEINPLLVNKSGLLAVDACIGLGQPVSTAISPYPEHLVESVTLKSGRQVTIRPIRGEDEPNHLEMWNKLSPESIRLRYFYSRGAPNHDELASWTQIDYDREMAFIVSAPRQDGKPGNETLGVVRASTDADNISAEFAVVMLDELQGEGIGSLLMQKMIDYCRSRGTLQIMGTTMTSNMAMQRLAKKLGFDNSYNHEEEAIEMVLQLHEPTEEWQRTRLEH